MYIKSHMSGDRSCVGSIDCGGRAVLNPNLDPLWKPGFEKFLRSLAQDLEYPGSFKARRLVLCSEDRESLLEDGYPARTARKSEHSLFPT